MWSFSCLYPDTVNCQHSSGKSRSRYPRNGNKSITWHWNPVPGASGYKWGVTNNYSDALDVGSALFHVQDRLNCNAHYISYVWANNSNCGNSAATALTSATAVCYVCGTTITDFRDSKTYTTVPIGTQCWFKQNLNFGNKIAQSVPMTNNGTVEKYCYEDNEDKCTTFGGIYTWNELMNYNNSVPVAQGICPTGWHVPAYDKMSQLITFLGGAGIAG